MRPRRAGPAPILLTVALLVAALLCATAAERAPAATSGECAHLQPCYSIPDTPWVAVPGSHAGTDASGRGVLEAGFALWRIDCSSGWVPAGRDYQVVDSDAPLLVNALVLPFGAGLTGSPSADFFGYWQGSEPTSFKPLVGCVPVQDAEAQGETPTATTSLTGGASASPTLRMRTVTRLVRPNRKLVVRHGCAAGERLVRAGHGVGFFRRRPPTMGELADLATARRVRRGGHIVVQVRTGPRVGDRERVAVQVHALCRAR